MRRFAPLASLVLIAVALPATAQDRRTDEHSYAEPAKVTVTDLDLDLDVDFGRKQLAGTATLALDWADDTDYDDSTVNGAGDDESHSAAGCRAGRAAGGHRAGRHGARSRGGLASV